MNKFSRFCLWNAILLILIASPLISEGRNEFDVLHYEIFIDLYEGLMQRNGYYNGYVKIKLVLNKSSNEINIHSASGVIQIDSVFFVRE